jgi:hypothetical protein
MHELLSLAASAAERATRESRLGFKSKKGKRNGKSKKVLLHCHQCDLLPKCTLTPVSSAKYLLVEFAVLMEFLWEFLDPNMF